MIYQSAILVDNRDPFTGRWYYNIEGTGRSTGGIPVSPGIMTLATVIQIKCEVMDSE
jgi:hypothetical protein